jgi:hypothetical protein
MAWALDMDLVGTDQPLSGEELLLVAVWHRVLLDVQKGPPAVREEARTFLRSATKMAYWADMLGVEVRLLERQAQAYLT